MAARSTSQTTLRMWWLCATTQLHWQVAAGCTRAAVPAPPPLLTKAASWMTTRSNPPCAWPSTPPPERSARCPAHPNASTLARPVFHKPRTCWSICIADCDSAFSTSPSACLLHLSSSRHHYNNANQLATANPRPPAGLPAYASHFSNSPSRVAPPSLGFWVRSCRCPCASRPHLPNVYSTAAAAPTIHACNWPLTAVESQYETHRCPLNATEGCGALLNRGVWQRTRSRCRRCARPRLGAQMPCTSRLRRSDPTAQCLDGFWRSLGSMRRSGRRACRKQPSC